MDWEALAAIATTALAVIALPVGFFAYRQLRLGARSSELDAMLRAYDLFDNEEHRRARRTVYNLKSEDLSSLDVDDLRWRDIEHTATAMDLVGILVVKGLVRKELIMERYLDVIIPLWDKAGSLVVHRRKGKGGIAWRYFEKLYEEAKKYAEDHDLPTEYKRLPLGSPDKDVKKDT